MNKYCNLCDKPRHRSVHRCECGCFGAYLEGETPGRLRKATFGWATGMTCPVSVELRKTYKDVDSIVVVNHPRGTYYALTFEKCSRILSNEEIAPYVAVAMLKVLCPNLNEEWSKWLDQYLEEVIQGERKKRKAKHKIWQEGETNNCYLCLKPLTFEEATVDHYIPQSKGGSNKQENLRICCSDCNNSKADVMPDDYMDENYEPQTKMKWDGKVFVAKSENGTKGGLE